MAFSSFDEDETICIEMVSAKIYHLDIEIKFKNSKVEDCHVFTLKNKLISKAWPWIQAFTVAGHLGGHIAAEDAHQVGRLLEQGVKLN